jgi:hypothetical protein
LADVDSPSNDEDGSLGGFVNSIKANSLEEPIRRAARCYWCRMRKLPPIDDATRAAILDGLAQANRGEFVPDEVVAAADERHGIGLSADQVAEVERRLAEPDPKILTMTEFRARLRKLGA